MVLNLVEAGGIWNPVRQSAAIGIVSHLSILTEFTLIRPMARVFGARLRNVSRFVVTY